MSVTTTNVLSALRDIDGVLGSFLIDLDGHVLARDLPPLFDVESLARSGFHLARLRAALESAGSGFESCVARFGPHLLLLRAAHVNTLCVLCPGGTNLAAVQMSTSLIVRRLYSPNFTPAPGSQPAGHFGGKAFEEEPEAQAAAPSRRFRGRSL